MAEQINCVYCRRKGVRSAEPTTEIVFRATTPSVVFTSGAMCADCARMLSHGATRAIKAFADEIQRLRKIAKIAPKPMSHDEARKEVDSFLRQLGLQS